MLDKVTNQQTVNKGTVTFPPISVKTRMTGTSVRSQRICAVCLCGAVIEKSKFAFIHIITRLSRPGKTFTAKTRVTAWVIRANGIDVTNTVKSAFIYIRTIQAVSSESSFAGACVASVRVVASGIFTARRRSGALVYVFTCKAIVQISSRAKTCKTSNCVQANRVALTDRRATQTLIYVFA